MALNTHSSVVDYMKSKGMDSSYNNRTKLAKTYGINNYQGTAQQNISLMNKVKTGGSPAHPSTNQVTVKKTTPPNNGKAPTKVISSKPSPKPTTPTTPTTQVPPSNVTPTDATGSNVLTEDQVQQMIDTSAKGYQNSIDNQNTMFQGMFGNLQNSLGGAIAGQGQGQGTDQYQQMFTQMQDQYNQLMQQLQYFQVLQQYYNSYGGMTGAQQKTTPFM